MSAGRRSQLCAGQQGAGRHGPAEAAGRAEQRDAPAGHGVRSASDSLISITGPFVISAPSLSLFFLSIIRVEPRLLHWGQKPWLNADY